MKSQIIETWQINNRVNLMLLDAIDDEALGCTLSERGGGKVGSQFAHLHNLRLWRLERYAKAAPRERIGKDHALDCDLLKACLSESADAIAAWLETGTDDQGKIRGFKRGVVPMLGYMIAHEAHHRGNIMLTLRQCGHRIPKDIRYGIWAWNQL